MAENSVYIVLLGEWNKWNIFRLTIPNEHSPVSKSWNRVEQHWYPSNFWFDQYLNFASRDAHDPSWEIANDVMARVGNGLNQPFPDKMTVLDFLSFTLYPRKPTIPLNPKSPWNPKMTRIPLLLHQTRRSAVFRKRQSTKNLQEIS